GSGRARGWRRRVRGHCRSNRDQRRAGRGVAWRTAAAAAAAAAGGWTGGGSSLHALYVMPERGRGARREAGVARIVGGERVRAGREPRQRQGSRARVVERNGSVEGGPVGERDRSRYNGRGTV